MMRIVTVAGAAHLLAGAQHRAIDVDGEGTGLQTTDQPRDDFGVEPFQGLFGRRLEAVEPTTDTAVGGQIPETANRCSNGSSFKKLRCRSRRPPTTSNPR